MTPKIWTIQAILNITTEFLRDKAIESPRLCAEVLLAHQLRKTRVELYLDFDRPLKNDEIGGFRSLVRRRLRREPLQYITGHQEFWSLDFTVNSAVLIPRPETERLVEEAVVLKKSNLLSGRAPLWILDLGTGSGAIAVALAKEIEPARIWASDISLKALTVARDNAKNHKLDTKIQFCQGDLWQPFSISSAMFDVIVSNPPYISAETFDALPPEICSYEPRIALNGGKKGMQFIEKIIRGSGTYLKPGGWLLMEMDPGQTESALNLIDATHCFSHCERLRDYQERYRLVKARKKDG